MLLADMINLGTSAERCACSSSKGSMRHATRHLQCDTARSTPVPDKDGDAKASQAQPQHGQQQADEQAQGEAVRRRLRGPLGRLRLLRSNGRVGARQNACALPMSPCHTTPYLAHTGT